MPRPRKKINPEKHSSQAMTVEMSGSSLVPVLEQALEESLESALLRSLQPLQADLQSLKQHTMLFEQQVQEMKIVSTQLPGFFASKLSHFLVQLQSTLNEQNSSDAKETLQEQLKQLITALSSWNKQLKTEISSQQQLIDSMQQLEKKLMNRKGNTP